MKRIWILRGATVLLLAVLAARPVAVRPETGLPAHWAVMLDSSASMRTRDPSPRIDAAKKIAADILHAFPESRLYQFSDEPHAVEAGAVDNVNANGNKTDLAKALKTAFDEKAWRGAVVLSDGRQVGGGDSISAAASIGRPLVLVGFGDRTLFKDIAVRSIQNPPFAFKNLPTSLSATISVVGFSGKNVNVKLRQGDNLIAMQTIQVAGDDVETTVHFQWTPTSLGSKTLTVEAGQYEGEITNVNNRKNATIDVGRDRFRVLYICGEPGPEYGFLRHQFKSDPAVELVTFVILRNAQNVLSAPENELSLIPFPTQDVLINQMATFDLVVFEEFSFTQYGLSPAVLMAIRQKVQDGGSFLLLGGASIYGAGSPYGITGISDMIPVPIGSPNVTTTSEPVAIHITAPSHPILKLEQNAVRNEEIWNSLPPLDSVAMLPPAKPGSTVLAVAKAGGVDHPVLTVWKVGKGRVGALSARTTWRWSMLKGSKDVSSDVYQQFWKNMVLWLTHSDEFKQVRISLESKEVQHGDLATMRIWVYDEYFKPLPDADIRLQLKSPEGKTIPIVPRVESGGVYAAEVKGDVLGTYEAEVAASRQGHRIGEERLRFQVVEGHSEQEDLRPDFELMRELAHTTNGQFLRAGEFSAKLIEEFNVEMKKKGGRKVLIWNSPWILVGLLVILGLEWFLRKKRGLP